MNLNLTAQPILKFSYLKIRTRNEPLASTKPVTQSGFKLKFLIEFPNPVLLAQIYINKKEYL